MAWVQLRPGGRAVRRAVERAGPALSHRPMARPPAVPRRRPALPGVCTPRRRRGDRRVTTSWTRRPSPALAHRRAASSVRFRQVSAAYIASFLCENISVFQVCRGYGDGSPWVWVWSGYGDRNSVPTAALQFLLVQRNASMILVMARCLSVCRL